MTEGKCLACGRPTHRVSRDAEGQYRCLLRPLDSWTPPGYVAFEAGGRRRFVRAVRFGAREARARNADTFYYDATGREYSPYRTAFDGAPTEVEAIPEDVRAAARSLWKLGP